MSLPAISRPGRGATLECSRGFQPTEKRPVCSVRRGATIDLGGSATMDFNRRSATHGVWRTANGGLKPTATIMRSLRDREAAASANMIQKHFEEWRV